MKWRNDRVMTMFMDGAGILFLIPLFVPGNIIRMTG